MTSVKDCFLASQCSFTPSHLIILSVLFFVVVLSSFQRFGRSLHRVQSYPVPLQDWVSIKQYYKINFFLFTFQKECYGAGNTSHNSANKQYETQKNPGMKQEEIMITLN